MGALPAREDHLDPGHTHVGFINASFIYCHVTVSMLMPVMDVGKVRVTMPQFRVHMPVRVRLPCRFGAIVAVLVMLVMNVPMFVDNLLVTMLVLVALSEM